MRDFVAQSVSEKARNGPPARKNDHDLRARDEISMRRARTRHRDRRFQLDHGGRSLA
ncbi:hypothetical protein [Sandaracinus amylolyticus]|uniref:hypothetical protein n=1 Tax=Sandaracinus amylolyticus TaxID=927083 RepID=UPI001F2F5CBF|nr:hypothetical protein [Sandaracinus amylolyticus]